MFQTSDQALGGTVGPVASMMPPAVSLPPIQDLSLGVTPGTPPTPTTMSLVSQTSMTGGMGLNAQSTMPVSVIPPVPMEFACPRRPNVGQEGRIILLRANHFQLHVPRDFIHHYDISIQPDKCPRRVNRAIIETMVQAYSHSIFNGQKPVFDGKKNLYTRDALPIGTEKRELQVTLPGCDRIFRVAVKWITRISLFDLKVALEGSRPMPPACLPVLDVVKRHLPSITYIPMDRFLFSSPDKYYRPLRDARDVCSKLQGGLILPSIVEDVEVDCEKERTLSPESGYSTDGPPSSRGPSPIGSSPERNRVKIQIETDSTMPGAKEPFGHPAAAVGPAPALLELACAESVEVAVPRDSIADLADYVAAGLQVHVGAATGTEKSAKWLKKVHKSLLKRALRQDADPSANDQCGDPDVLDPHSRRVVAERMLIRSINGTDHVVMMGSVTMFLDLLCCPYAFQGQCSEEFAADCKGLKAHLESVHHLNNVRINLLCPFSGETEGAQQCREIIYDPQGRLMCTPNHVAVKHPGFTDEIVLGLCYGYDEAVEGLYRKKLPRWVLELKKDLPSQNIPETICNPIFVQNNKLHYKCFKSCPDMAFATIGGILEHLEEQHSIDVNQTKVLESCPAQECTVKMLCGTSDMLMHVKACHAEMLGMSTDYSDNAIKKREELERTVESTAKGLKQKLATSRLPDGCDNPNLVWICQIPCPVRDCWYKDFNAELVIWHIGASHRDLWNLA